MANGQFSASAANQALLDAAQNGVPVLQIAPPSNAGVSHNKFQDFNVDTQGLILNNALEAGISQLGGALDRNARLNGRAADLVLNEVTGVGRTSLTGFTEMFGHAADYILANPNGITCDGCGFINIPRATLGTGVPVVDPLSGFSRLSVSDGGDVQVGPGGLDALDRAWTPGRAEVARANVAFAALAAEGVDAAPVARRNRWTDEAGGRQLRYGRDGRWYPYRSREGTWWPAGPPERDPAAALDAV